MQLGLTSGALLGRGEETLRDRISGHEKAIHGVKFRTLPRGGSLEDWQPYFSGGCQRLGWLPVRRTTARGLGGVGFAQDAADAILDGVGKGVRSFEQGVPLSDELLLLLR
jgi:hypothetical protein